MLYLIKLCVVFDQTLIIFGCAWRTRVQLEEEEEEEEELYLRLARLLPPAPFPSPPPLFSAGATLACALDVCVHTVAQVTTLCC